MKNFYRSLTGDAGDGTVPGIAQRSCQGLPKEECEVEWDQDWKGFVRVKEMIFEVIQGDVQTQG